RSRLQRLEELEAMEANGTLEKESKKQASRLKREMRKIKSNLDGVRKMSRLPGVVVVTDSRKEYLALSEARKLGIATIGLLDTNSDPDTVDVGIPANDDSIRAITLLLNEMAEAVAIGKTMVQARSEVQQKPKRVRSRKTLARATEDKPEAGGVAVAAPVETAASAEPAAAPAEKPAEPAKVESAPAEPTSVEPAQEDTKTQ
ncbi:30S ribosomal protein S2, partial [Planctomycetota bacterium]